MQIDLSGVFIIFIIMLKNKFKYTPETIFQLQSLVQCIGDFAELLLLYFMVILFILFKSVYSITYLSHKAERPLIYEHIFNIIYV